MAETEISALQRAISTGRVPQESESASIRSARRFSTNPCLRGSRDLLSNNSKNLKICFRSKISYKTCSTLPQLHPTPGTSSKHESLTSGKFYTTLNKESHSPWLRGSTSHGNTLLHSTRALTKLTHLARYTTAHSKPFPG